MSIKVLHDQPPGTFLIRFSQTSAGQFALAYVEYDARTGMVNTKHSLVKSEDISSNKKLPDFLREKSHLLTLRKYDFVNNAFENVGKDTALGHFYTKRKSPVPQNGYVGM
eukprot:TRINITY_DN1736_c0_g2_i2.p1 TRINITY_DN1736_c0_g2~~TRINITY_DN1736_c0_g2_i2.p1  ORF type:complete len:110 (-),score=22.23 TRINITY_DN1736_c0_g2_i2:80-409(-)